MISQEKKFIVKILPNDYWEIEKFATVEFKSKEGALLILDQPFLMDNGVRCSRLVASARHENKSISDIEKGIGVLCSIILVPDHLYDRKLPLNVSWWRGGGAFIADVLLVN